MPWPAHRVAGNGTGLHDSRICGGTKSDARGAMMTRTVLLAAVLSACTGSTYYPSAGPQYAQQTTTSQSPDGTQSTSTTTYQHSSYEQPAPPPPAPEPQPASYEPPPPDDGPRCDPRDNREMCTALGVVYDVGRLLERLEERSCNKAARALNRYADRHDREIEIMLSLEETQTAPRLRQFAERHQVEFALVIAQAQDLDARCGGDDRFDRAMRRLGFRGLLGRR
jgi:hypothetical protein